MKQKWHEPIPKSYKGMCKKKELIQNINGLML